MQADRVFENFFVDQDPGHHAENLRKAQPELFVIKNSTKDEGTVVKLVELVSRC
jgi:hypothetical protein